MSVIRLALGQLLFNFLYVLIMEEHHICFGQTLVNIAPNKSYRQSSRYLAGFGTSPPSHAANGNTGGAYNSTNCIHTEDGDRQPWWQVDLGRKFLVSNISIWTRTGLPVGQYHDKPWRVDVRCQRPIYGQIVKITRATKTNDTTLNMCEFEIWVDSRLSQCEPGLYKGWNSSECTIPCSSNCLRRAERTFCYAATGQCAYGCVDGHYGDRCEEDCSDNCDTRGCDRTSGNCTCKPGYRPPLCKQELIMKGNAKSLTWPIVGAASGGGLLLAGIVTVIVCWRRRRQAKRSNNGGQIVSSAFELSPHFAKDLTKGSVDATEETSSTHGKVGGLAVPEESGENYYEPFYVSQNYDAVHHVYTDMKSLPRNQN